MSVWKPKEKKAGSTRMVLPTVSPFRVGTFLVYPRAPVSAPQAQEPIIITPKINENGEEQLLALS